MEEIAGVEVSFKLGNRLLCLFIIESGNNDGIFLHVSRRNWVLVASARDLDFFVFAALFIQLLILEIDSVSVCPGPLEVHAG